MKLKSNYIVIEERIREQDEVLWLVNLTPSFYWQQLFDHLENPLYKVELVEHPKNKIHYQKRDESNQYELKIH